MALSRHTKKLFFELKYVGEEYNETKEVFEDSKLDFNFRLEELRPDSHRKNNVEKSFDVARSENSELDDNTLDDDSDIVSSSIPGWAKKLFHKIALKSHPDKILKIDDEHERKFLKETYSRASDLYESENYIDLLEVAFDLNLNLDFVSDEQLDKIKKRIKEKRSIVSDMRSSFYWIWSQSTFDQQEEMLKKVVSDLGWNIKTEEVVRVMKKKPPSRRVGRHPGKRLSHIRNNKN